MMETACQRIRSIPKPVETSSTRTLLLTVEVPLHRGGALHFTDLQGVFHSLHQLFHSLAGALIVVSCLRTKTRGKVIIEWMPDDRTLHRLGCIIPSKSAHVLQAELQLLFVGHEVMSHLHCQVVER